MWPNGYAGANVILLIEIFCFVLCGNAWPTFLDEVYRMTLLFDSFVFCWCGNAWPTLWD